MFLQLGGPHHNQEAISRTSDKVRNTGYNHTTTASYNIDYYCHTYLHGQGMNNVFVIYKVNHRENTTVIS